jgi:phosphatidylserine decarboxylase
MRADSAVRAALELLLTLPQYLLPQHALSGVMHALTRVRWVPLKNLLIGVFVRLYRVDMSEAATPDALSYPSFNDFFTRALRPGSRPLEHDPAMPVCPIDGTVSQVGPIEAGRIFQAKGRSFDVVELLGGDPARARHFAGGSFATLYLSPRDYHRVHMPVAARLRETTYIPCRLFAVNPRTTRVVPRLFARNERVAMLFDGEAGPMAVVMVGAIFVGSIETVAEGVITPAQTRRAHTWHCDDGPALARGAELGRFNMGSTVILLFARDRIHWSSALQPGATVRMGQALGRIQRPMA